MVLQRPVACGRHPVGPAALGAQPRLADRRPGDDGGQALLLRGADGPGAPGRIGRGPPGGRLCGVPRLGHRLHRDQGGHPRVDPRARGGTPLAAGAGAASRGPRACRRALPSRGRRGHRRAGPRGARRLAGPVLVDRLAGRLCAPVGVAAAGPHGGVRARRAARGDPSRRLVPGDECETNAAPHRSAPSDRGKADRRSSWGARGGTAARAGRVARPTRLRDRRGRRRRPVDTARHLPAAGRGAVVRAAPGPVRRPRTLVGGWGPAPAVVGCRGPGGLRTGGGGGLPRGPPA